MWIDDNNNESLIDDGVPDATYRYSFNVYSWIRTLQVSYTWNGEFYEAPYILRVTALRSASEWSLFVGSCCLREGFLLVEQTPTAIWLGDMNTDGLFDDLDELLVIIDADGDGEPALDYSIVEQFAPQMPFSDAGQFQLGGVTYAIDQVSPDGRYVQVSEAQVQAEPLPSVIVGEPAPAFAVTSLQGEPFSSKSLLGKPVLLYFTPSEDANGHTVCTGCFPDDRLRDLAEQFDERDVQILVISTWPESPACDAVRFGDIVLPLIEADMDLVRAYRPGTDWLVVIGRDGTVLGKDSVRPIYDAGGRVMGADSVPLHVGDVFDLLWMDDAHVN